MAGRVVFLHGLLGATLLDTSLTRKEAKRICEKNIKGREKLLKGDLYPCDKRPESLWGEVGALHWLYDSESWLKRITSGNSLIHPGNVRADSLVDIDVKLGSTRFEFRPYTSFVKALRDTGADLLVFTYDWRLSVLANMVGLHAALLSSWFRGRGLDEAKEEEKITFIGHSLGGLLARAYLESPAIRLGRHFARRLITIGTPQLGAPDAYINRIGGARPLFLDEDPFYEWVHATLLSEMQKAKISPKGDFSTHIIPKKIQQEFAQFMVSIIELLPVYDFVSARRKKREKHRDTYRRERHEPTKKKVLDLIDQFRSQLVESDHLNRWLAIHGIQYHFVAATGFKTTIGYHRGNKRRLTSKDGDGTVPLESAHFLTASASHLEQKIFKGGKLNHARLCERGDVQKYCLATLRKKSATAQAAARNPTIDDFVLMADDILKSVKNRSHLGVVLSVIQVSGDGTDREPLIDTETEPGKGNRKQLKNPPKYLSSPEVHEVQSTKHGTFEYVWTQSNEKSQFGSGGFLFLPTADEQDIFLVTFNVGPMGNRYKSCSNDHHAEVQFERWFLAQPRDWQKRINRASIANRSRKKNIKGYSPCNPCCDDLVHLTRSWKKARSGKDFAAKIGWLELYTGRSDCGHPTNKESLRKLKAADWALDGPEP